MSGKSNQDRAIETGIKFDFYLVALTFTVLAFAVQTGKFVGHAVPDVIETLSWFAFLISGLAGLSRLEYFPVAYRAKHHLQTAEIIDADVEKALPRIEYANRRKYKIQRWGFIAGIVALVIARAIIQYQDMY